MVFNTNRIIVIACGILATSGHLIPDYCGPPRCNTMQEITTLQIAEDRRYFYQCARNQDSFFAPVLRSCGAGTVFGFYQQVCVFEFDWRDLCANGITTTTTPAPTTTPGTTTTTQKPTTTTTSLPITTPATTTTSQLTSTTTTSLPITTPATTTTSQLTSTTTTSLPITTPATTTTSQLTSTTTTSLPITTPATTTTSQLTSTTTTSLPITTTTPPVTTVSPPLRICSRPQCNTALELVIQHPSELADAFYLCVRTPQNTYEAAQLFCDFGSFFSFEQQACVPPEQWLNACDRSWAPTCQPVMCNNTLPFIILQPAADREHFFQCMHQGSQAEVRTCEPGTWFGFRQQACVQPEQWIDDCGWQ